MSRSHLFSLQERHAAVRLSHLAQSLHAAQTETENSRDMGARLEALIGAVSMSEGVVTVATLRERAHLTDRLAAEQQRQMVRQRSAEAQVQDIKVAIQDQMRLRHSAQNAARLARQAEAEERAQKQDAARPAFRLPR